jgi:elongation factor Tu-like protein
MGGRRRTILRFRGFDFACQPQTRVEIMTDGGYRRRKGPGETRGPVIRDGRSVKTMAEKVKSAPRCVALVGPYLSGKTTLMEQLLLVSGAIHRRGSVREGNTVGDHSAEARARQMSTARMWRWWWPSRRSRRR